MLPARMVTRNWIKNIISLRSGQTETLIILASDLSYPTRQNLTLSHLARLSIRVIDDALDHCTDLASEKDVTLWIIDDVGVLDEAILLVKVDTYH